MLLSVVHSEVQLEKILLALVTPASVMARVRA